MTAASTTALYAKVRLPHARLSRGPASSRVLWGLLHRHCLLFFYTSNHISFYYSISFIDGLVIFAEKDL